MTNSSAARVALWRPITAVGLVLGLLVVVGYTLWERDWKWGMPTPRPAHLRQPPVGAPLELPEQVAAQWSTSTGRPLLLHFFTISASCADRGVCFRPRTEGARTRRRKGTFTILTDFPRARCK